MDEETSKYIIHYFSQLLTADEKMAIRYTNSMFKLQHSSSENINWERIYREKGWLSDDPSVLDLLKDGYDNFEKMVASRILAQNPDKVFFNNCPKCNKLARTPNAKQCRHCGHNWHAKSAD